MATKKLAIDFDSINTNIYMLGEGLVLSEPTVAAVSLGTNDEIKSIGVEAKKLIGKTAKDTKIIFPVFEGEIVNEKVASGLLSSFCNKLQIKAFDNVHAIFPVPCGVTGEMLDRYKKVARNSGINKLYFSEAPILSALGQRIPLNDSSPCFIVDMAGGVTNIAAVTLDGVIAGISVNFGANKINTDIIDYVAEYYGLQIGLLTAEKLKKEIGSLSDNDALSCIANGRDLKTGAPRSVSIKAMDIKEPVSMYYNKIAELIDSLLKKLPPEVSADIRNSGIYISGIASDVYGLEKYYKDKFGIKINIAENGGMSVALGGGIAIGNNDLLKRVTISFK